MAISQSESATNTDSKIDTVTNRIRVVPMHFHGNALAKLYGPRGRIAQAVKKVKYADILERTSVARKQAWSLAHVSKGNSETDSLIVEAMIYAYFGCECVNATTHDFREMLEESLANGTANALGGNK